MPLLSSISRRLKERYFLRDISSDDVVLEIGCGDGWVGRYLKSRGVREVVGMDTNPPAAIVGDIREWKSLGLKAQSFDVIVAFEVLGRLLCVAETRRKTVGDVALPACRSAA
jgi:2-polyprenyl-3-methyl-5-hydroxy-6-metoxy-1,4-benzoquinol methylase